MSDASDEPVRPVLRVVRGEPNAEELAVLTAVVAASGGGDDEPAAPARRGGWRDPARLRRRQLYQGPGAWRSSAW